ncbi:hypothetical protein [Dokdonia sp. Hel_I_53]|uniref:hypothetical protein n=1 Tax=Dokdonia sp. Hel_I_53 TaxID=1566287 RepID=UPI00119A9FD9|nr:hypothetical protein [Dokdonia sp. Hel_I_53]TVZ50915.1 stealth protein CR2 [Dokdonia sp. Hel_I_53]
MIETKGIEIDAVILWVDGSDMNHKDKMRPFLPLDKNIEDESVRTRYDQVNEIEYTVNSILKFAPYIRKIFIVTDNQKPSFLNHSGEINKYNNVQIIDHKVIFKGYEKFLPTFNSRSIETCIHRIPTLSEHFIYFNDDFFLINKTVGQDFFKNGFPVLRGKWLSFPEKKFFKKFKKKRIGHKSAQQKSAKIVGLNEYYNFRHTPHPLRKSTLENFYNENHEHFINNIKYRFRNGNQYLAQGLSNHLEIINNSCEFENDLRLLYFRSFKKPLWWYRFKLKNKETNKLFLGLQSLDRSSFSKMNFFLSWLEERTRI